MASFNKVILMGNLTRDPELRYTPNGRALVRFGLAVNRSWRTESGEQREEVTFVDIDAYGRQAETISQYLKRGNPVLIEGRLRLHTWDDKQTNQKQSRLRVDLETFKFVGSPSNREAGAGGGNAPSSPPAPRPAPREAPSASDDDPPVDDDVPF